MTITKVVGKDFEMSADFSANQKWAYSINQSEKSAEILQPWVIRRIHLTFHCDISFNEIEKYLKSHINFKE